MDTQARTITKTLVWRFIATMIMWMVAFHFTDTLETSLKITLVAAIVSMTAYYVHERVWNRIRWGKKRR